MKVKALVVLLAILASISFSAVLYAQEGGTGWAATMSQDFQKKWGQAKIHQFEGTVISHDVACHCFVIKGMKGNIILQDDYAKFEQEYDKAKGLEIGKKASGDYKTIGGINYAVEVHQK